MSVSFDCRENRDLVGRRAFFVWDVCGRVCLTCLLAFVGLCRMESTAVADGGALAALPTILQRFGR